MREALRFRVARPDGAPATIFFVHGHQGTPESDRFSKLARLPVRYIWPLIQRWQGAKDGEGRRQGDGDKPMD